MMLRLQMIALVLVSAVLALTAKAQEVDTIHPYPSVRLPAAPNCKRPDSSVIYLDMSALLTPEISSPALANHRPKAAAVQGNVSYWFNYRSNLDSPFAQTDLQQHIVQTTFQVKLFEWLPLTAIATTRKSNSPFFSDRTDLALQYRKPDPRQVMMGLVAPYLRWEQQLQASRLDRDAEQWTSLKKQLNQLPANDLSELLRKKLAKQLDSLEQLARDYQNKLDQAKKLAAELQTKQRPNLQMLAAAAERKLLGLDSLQAGAQARMGKAGERADSLRRKSERLQSRMEDKAEDLQQKATRAKAAADSIRQRYAARLGALNDSARNLYRRLHQLIQQPQESKLAQKAKDSVQTALDDLAARYPLLQLLSAVQKFSIGRAVYDYSELTIRNVLVNGVELELQTPRGWYLAGGMGSIDYAFRDFLFAGRSAQPRQELRFVRLGYGAKTGTHLYFTYFAGRKAIYNQLGQPSSPTVLPLTGTSVELQWPLAKGHRLTAEYARSALLYQTSKNIPFSQRDNAAYYLRYQGEFRAWHSTVDASFRHNGALFQNFSLFTPGTRQTVVNLATRHQLFQRRLMVSTGLRTNEFVNPFTQVRVATNSLLATLQATWAKAGWPTLSAGLAPSSITTLLDGQQMFLHQFNSINAMATHQLALGTGRLSTTLNYNKLLNRNSDSGFQYYNASILTAYAQWRLKRWALDASASRIAQSYLPQTEAQLGLEHRLGNWLTAYGALKSVLPEGLGLRWGNTQRLTIKTKRLGEFQLVHERLYLPSFRRNILPTDVGTLFYTKTF